MKNHMRFHQNACISKLYIMWYDEIANFRSNTQCFYELNKNSHRHEVQLNVLNGCASASVCAHFAVYVRGFYKSVVTWQVIYRNVFLFYTIVGIKFIRSLIFSWLLEASIRFFSVVFPPSSPFLCLACVHFNSVVCLIVDTAIRFQSLSIYIYVSSIQSFMNFKML